MEFMKELGLEGLLEGTYAGEWISGEGRDQRLMAARNMLDVAQGRTIAEIAYRFGFADQAQFSRLFKAAFGRTPSDHRRSRSLRY